MVFKTREILEHIIYTRKMTYKYQGKREGCNKDITL